MKKFDKPYMSSEDMLKKLKSKNLIINSDLDALELLEELGYNRLINGYKHPFVTKTNNKESFIPGVTIIDLYSLYVLDSQFRELFLTNVLHIENHLETLLGNLIAQNYNVNSHWKNDSNNPRPDVLSYLNKKYYNTKLNTTLSVLKHVEGILNGTPDNPTKYYREKKNHVPPWILTQNLPLGTLIKFYKIQKKNIKDAVVSSVLPVSAKDLNADKLLFEISFQLLKEFRNTAAHSSPIYSKKVELKNYASKSKLKEYLGTGIFSTKNDPNVKLFGRNDLYGALLALILLTNNISRRNYIIEELKNLDNNYKKSAYSKIYILFLKSANLPADYIKRLENAAEYLSVSKAENSVYSGNIAQLKNVYYVLESKTYHLSSSCPKIALTDKDIHETLEQFVIQRGFKKCEMCGK